MLVATSLDPQIVCPLFQVARNHVVNDRNFNLKISEKILT